MKPLLLNLCLLLVLTSSAQKKEETFNFQFKPSKSGPYYYVVTEKKDTVWERKAYFISQKSQAMEAFYKDEACKIPDGYMTWFHPTRVPKSKGLYVDGKKEGTWLEWNDKGLLIDSANYKNGNRTGVSYRWHNNGMLRDSLDFDGQGNGVQVSWYDDGSLACAGRWIQDISKRGRWKYYHKNGETMATEDYEYGKKVTCTCYNESGVQLDSTACIDREAEPSGGKKGWQSFLEEGMTGVLDAKVRNREWSEGQATVVIRFIVEPDGSLSDFTSLTNYGSSIEYEVIRMLRRAPRWTPARQHGQAVRSFHTQPLTMQISRQ